MEKRFHLFPIGLAIAAVSTVLVWIASGSVFGTCAWGTLMGLMLALGYVVSSIEKNDCLPVDEQDAPAK